jgi:hypothetical protein
MVDTYGPMAGASALGANALVRYAGGGSFPLFTVQMYEGMGIGWATSLLGFLSLALLPVPYIFFKWGPQIRSKSTYTALKSPKKA